MRRLIVTPSVATCLALTFIGSTWPQGSNTVLEKRHRNHFTVLDQISNPIERNAIQALYTTQKSRNRAQRAEEFLANYPQSWFLPQAYEIAAKGYIELSNSSKALYHGNASLRLLPENPSLLIQLANIQALEGYLAEARTNARDGLDLLERMAVPRSVDRRAWPNLARQLRVSGLLVLGRVAVTEALRISAGPEQETMWQECERILSHARYLSPANPEIAYLMGLSLLVQGKRDESARSFLDVYRQKGHYKFRALGYLRRIQKSNKEMVGVAFDDFLEVVENSDLNSLSQTSPQMLPRQALSDDRAYAGTETCRRCHADKHSAWEQTGMARMFQSYRSQEIIGDFEHNNEFYAGDNVRLIRNDIAIIEGSDRYLFARMIKRDGNHYFQIKHSDGRWQWYPVDYTIGSKWQQAYATRLPNGEIHVLPIQYNRLNERWINFWKVIDPLGSVRADVRLWERHESYTSYFANCAVCHTSQLWNVKGDGFEAGNLEFREPGINCEMCHGPSANHVSIMMAGKSYEKHALEPPVRFQAISSQDYVAICAQCHMQSALRKPGSEGELNYSRHGEVFFLRTKTRSPAEFSNKGRYKDGRFRETSFIVESLLRSPCYKRGQVNCGHCHDPHPRDPQSNPASLKFLEQPNRMCLQCHASFTGNIEAHTRHSLDSEASRCISCHMPPIMDALLFRAKTHRIGDIPDVDMTVRFGQEESPNACLICHKDRDIHWLEEQSWVRGVHDHAD